MRRSKKKGIKNSFNQQLLKSIDAKIQYLKMNPLAGDLEEREDLERRREQIAARKWKRMIVREFRDNYKFYID